MSLLEIHDAVKRYPKSVALEHVELTVQPGEIMVIMGPSGCGKTTLLRCILGALELDQGRIVIDGKDITSTSIENRNIGYVPQEFGLFPHLTVFDNIAFGLRIKKMLESDIQSKVRQMLLVVGLSGFDNRKPDELSGGQRQRVALCRALVMNPSVLLLDEPLSNIDEDTKADVRQNMKLIQQSTKTTTVCVTHNPEDAFDLGDHIAIMVAGKVIQSDTPRDLLDHPVNDRVKRLISIMYCLRK